MIIALVVLLVNLFCVLYTFFYCNIIFIKADDADDTTTDIPPRLLDMEAMKIG